RHASIYAWDLRTHLDAPLAAYTLPHAARTNQKIKFDVDLGGRWLASGDHRGHISLFDLHDPEASAASPTTEPTTTTASTTHTPTLEYPAHDDAIGSVAFHPLRPSLLSVSGSRHFLEDDLDSESGSDDDGEAGGGGEDEDGDDGAATTRVVRRVRPTAMDRSIKTWSFA
ncbi:hypothetical protein C0993_009267, partial [Termitomyces sp. T159_Od127]